MGKRDIQTETEKQRTKDRNVGKWGRKILRKGDKKREGMKEKKAKEVKEGR
jgi:hypothetical protein